MPDTVNDTGNLTYSCAETVPPGLSLAHLITAYQTDPDSPIRKLRYSTKEHYRNLMARLDLEHGWEVMADINARLLKRWHEQWSEGGKVAMGHSLIGMLRTLVNFGATILEDKECERLALVLHRMKFEMGKPRTSALSAEQVIAIRVRANALGLHSIALAQAFQFDCTFRQKDCIGEWVPVTEKGPDAYTYGDKKWVSGIRWEEIDEHFVLRHVTSKRQKKVEIDLTLAAMVMEELGGADRSACPASGPVIVGESLHRPWTAVGFRRMWRRIADECGIPNAVKNMDTRAGAITEALASGANLDAVRKSATHSNASMTSRYSRGGADAIAEVMTKRAAARSA